MPNDSAFAPNLVRTLEEHLADTSSSWSIGAPGAIAEFHRSAGDVCHFEHSACVVSPFGAIRFEPFDGVRAHAYEILSARPERWHHGIALGARVDQCMMSGRRAITEVGPDRDAIRTEDRDGVLFDLALRSPHCDFYVRVFDRLHIERLRDAVGTSLLDPCCTLYDDIVRMSPHRVFVSRLARVEIYQRIGEPGAPTPDGPHTHLLPKLFRPERSHWSTLGLPADFAPCLTLYPANPVFDRDGRPKSFDAAEHDAFQKLLALYGDRTHVAVKELVWRTARSGAAPTALSVPAQRHARIACRVALRQLLHSDDRLFLTQWCSAFEPRAALAV
jgi:hypothetical protein